MLFSQLANLFTDLTKSKVQVKNLNIKASLHFLPSPLYLQKTNVKTQGLYRHAPSAPSKYFPEASAFILSYFL